MVWADPRSLATTCGIIIIFSSYGYLDVSVPHVRLPVQDDRPSTCRVAPFGNPGIKDYLHLPPAYRSLSRPSSPPRAKASTVCPCLLSFVRSQLNVNRIDISSACSFIRYFILRCPSCQRSFSVDSWQATVDSLSTILSTSSDVWRITDSNRWPSACKADALASWANPPF